MPPPYPPTPPTPRPTPQLAPTTVHDLCRDQVTAVQLSDLYRGMASAAKGGTGHEGHPMFGRGTRVLTHR